MISIENISKNYGAYTAVKNLSFSLKKGEIIALLGVNGAGKTTTMKMLTGYISPDSGDIFYEKKYLQSHIKSIQKSLGYLPENAPLYLDLTIYEHLELSADLHGIEGKEDAIEKIAHECDIFDRLFFPVKDLSRGYRQRVALAQAMIHNPKVLILDEPTGGLDPQQAQHIRALIQKFGKTRYVLFSSHIMQEVEALADRVVVLHKGEKIAEGTVGELKKQQSGISAVIRGAQKNIITFLKNLPEVSSVQVIEKISLGVNRYEIITTGDSIEQISTALMKEGFTFREISILSQSLEEVFCEFTR
ncbi:gliding motility-associated ABC transporter ATP-binding subunit GldA [Candidatus Peregrinibacteria bacterium]|nr:MAG: gliding motility-associated ABC transporter ATP-binding subunit GldA [Candidatus Peregrinibacteria bacterium]